MKRVLLCCLMALFCAVACGCNGSKIISQEKATSSEIQLEIPSQNSSKTTEKSESNYFERPSSRQDDNSFEGQLNKVRDEYYTKIETKILDNEITLAIDDNELRYMFKSSAEKAMNKEREKLNYIMKYRTKGSLVAPEAPKKLDDALKYIKTEYKGKISESTLNEFIDMYSNEEETYKNNPQASFDIFRESIQNAINNQ